MFLGLEIGGTKLQLGVGPGDGRSLVALERFSVDRAGGAEGIRAQIAQIGRALVKRHTVTALGIGFGGPVDVRSGRTITSHQIEGWTDFRLVQWCRETFGLPARIANDADTAGLAEARFGGGRGKEVVFYITVGSGIGGALILNGQIFLGGAGMAGEIGHLRPGPGARLATETVESRASGWGITTAAKALIDRQPTDRSAVELLERSGGDRDRLTTKIIAAAAAEGNRLALEVFREAVRTLGWAVAQVITLVSPQVIVTGGGVSLVGESLFFTPLREEVEHFVFPPLRRTYEIVPAALGEEVVVHGALALAAEAT